MVYIIGSTNDDGVVNQARPFISLTYPKADEDERRLLRRDILSGAA